jgi:acetoin utilization deacetylase AcuC-like enzyme
MAAVWTQRQRLHAPRREVWVGVTIDGLENPERGEVIHDALAEAGARMVKASAYPRSALEAVHDPAFLDHLESAHRRWMATEYPIDPGQDEVVPYVFPLPQIFGPIERRMPVAESARTGWYAMDTMTTLTAGTYAAAVAAAECALTAADLVLGGEAGAYALCRPPGHHAGRDFYGGSCYLNNAAIAAQHLRAGGFGRVGIVDLDAHHGNGTQIVFYERADVAYASVHIDPDAGWFPHYVGRADERGAGAGLGANVNVPLPEGAGDEPWLDAVDRLCEAVAASEALVVSLGVDGHADDPESPLEVTNAGYAEGCRRLGSLGLPTVLVQEGGYDLATLGPLVSGSLIGFEKGQAT